MYQNNKITKLTELYLKNLKYFNLPNSIFYKLLPNCTNEQLI